MNHQEKITDFIKFTYTLYNKLNRDGKNDQAQELLEFSLKYVNNYYQRNGVPIQVERDIHKDIQALAWNGGIQSEV